MSERRALTRLERFLLWSITAIAAVIAWVATLSLEYSALPHEWPLCMMLSLFAFSFGYAILVGAGTDDARWAVYAGPPMSLLLSAAFVIAASPVKTGQRDAENVFAAYTANNKALDGEPYIDTQSRGFLQPGDVYLVCRDTDGDRRFCGWVDLREPRGQRLSDADWEQIPEY